MKRNLVARGAGLALVVFFAVGLLSAVLLAQQPQPTPPPAAADPPAPAAAPAATAPAEGAPTPPAAAAPAADAPAAAAPPAAGAPATAAPGTPPAAESPAAAAEAARAVAEELIEKESEEAPTGAAAPVPVRPEDKLPYDANLARDKFKVQNILRGGQLAPADEATFDKYYTGYAIARWTQPDLRVQLHRFRQEMRNDLQLAKEPVHGRLVAFALNAMKEFTRPDKNYHPAVQANAMLMIAELNEVERTAQTDAVPSPAALDVMLEVVDAAKGAKYSEGVKVAALVGIRRHAEARGDSIPKVAEVSKAMLAILAAKAPIDRPADGFHWMQGQACEILGLIGQPGDKNIVVRALAYIVRTQSIPAGTRTAAARSLGRIKFANATGLIASDLAATVAQFVVDACDNELVIYENYEPVYRRRIKAALQGALIGLNGVTPELKGISGLANTPQEQEYVKDIVSKIDELITTLDDEELYEEEVVEGIKKASEEISGLIDQKPGN